MKKYIIALCLVFACSVAHAQHWGISIFGPGYSVSYGSGYGRHYGHVAVYPYPVYAAPVVVERPVYYPPAVVYYPETVVVHRYRPVIYDRYPSGYRYTH